MLEYSAHRVRVGVVEQVTPRSTFDWEGTYLNKIVWAVAVALSLISAGPALANHEETQAMIAVGSLLGISTTTSTTSSIAGAAGAGGGGGGGGEGSLARMYLQNNAVQLARDLPRGEGPVIDDMATRLGLNAEETALFGQVLRNARAELLPLAQLNGLDDARALLFMRRVAELARGEPVLAARIQKLQAQAAASSGTGAAATVR